VFIDRARTGKVLGGRKALADLRQAAQAGEISRIWVYKWDRLGRSLSDSASIVKELEKTGSAIISATEGADALTRGVLLSVAEYYSTALSERVAGGLRQRFNEHAFTGSIAPFGYRVTKRAGRKCLEIDPDEAAVVKDIFADFLAGTGIKAIARSLTQRGVQPRTKKGPWAWTTIRHMLESNWFVGRVYFGRWACGVDDETGKRWQKLKPESEWSHYDDEELRIITDEQFEAVQTMLVSRAKPYLRYKTRGQRQVFTGLGWCQCGSLLYRHSYKDRSGAAKWVYLYCGRRHREGASSACGCSLRVREDKLLASMIETLLPIITGGEKLIADAVAIAKDKTTTNRQDAERVRAAIATIDKDRDKLLERLVDGDLNMSVKRMINDKTAELEAQRQELQATLESLTDAANDNTEEFAEAVQQALDEAKQALTSVSSPRQLNDLLRELVGEFTVHGDGTVSPREEASSMSNQGPAPAVRRASGRGPTRPARSWRLGGA
jgi:DNA invertase Pin-like site-specific DNA recombinase